MSQHIFPKFQGLNWDYNKKALWSNITQIATSGKETRIKLWSYPKYEMTISYDFLTNQAYQGNLNSGDFEQLVGFYNLVGGSFDDFLYEDPIENEIIIPQPIGVGDEQETVFQLNRKVGNWIEPIFGVNETPKLFIDDVETTDFTLNDFGMVTFTNPPAGVITWTGKYYFRCRFKNDNLDFDQMFKCYHTGSLELQTVKI